MLMCLNIFWLFRKISFGGSKFFLELKNITLVLEGLNLSNHFIFCISKAFSSWIRQISIVLTHFDEYSKQSSKTYHVVYYIIHINKKNSSGPKPWGTQACNDAVVENKLLYITLFVRFAKKLLAKYTCFNRYHAFYDLFKHPLCQKNNKQTVEWPG